MSTEEKKFHNAGLQKAVERSLPWFDLWGQFKESVLADIEQFEALLNEKKIPISGWVEVGEQGFLGWAPNGKERVMALLFKKTLDGKELPVAGADLETKVMIFPYISELSYLLCTRIKLAHTSQVVMEDYAAKALSAPTQQPDTPSAQPVKIAKYI